MLSPSAPSSAFAPRGFVAISTLRAPPAEQAAIEGAFRERKRLVDRFAGFRGLQLVKARGSGEYLLLLEWDSMESFRAYVKSEAFHHAHPETVDGVEPGPLRVYDLLLDSRKGD